MLSATGWQMAAEGGGLRGWVLRFFPAGAHGLTLARDPDGLLADEAVLAALGDRGFRVVAEADPVALRHRVEEARPWSAERPLVVVTEGELAALPYDLWREGHWVELALHGFFPGLDYPTVRGLSGAGRERLGRSPMPAVPLGPRGTAQHVLRYAFGAEPGALAEPAALVGWLTDYHRHGDSMPDAIRGELLAALRGVPAYGGWDLDRLVADAGAFARFVGEEWAGYVGVQTGRVVREAAAPYRARLGFDDPALQDAVPRLVRTGVLARVEVAEPGRLPGWLRPGVVGEDEDRRPRRLGELCALLEGELAELGGAEARWADWQRLARAWAELQGLRDDQGVTLEPEQAAIRRIEQALDEAFLPWLRRQAGPLAGKRVPTPHHVFHVPDAIAYWRRQGGWERVALLVLDGMALRDWLLIGEAWRARHPEWGIGERLLLAQVPTITAISRQAMIAGLRPADFAETIGHNRDEGRRWAAFWGRQDEPLPAEACVYGRVEEEGVPLGVFGSRVQAVCLVENSIDEMVHGASLGAAEVQASLRLWLERVSPRLEGVIGGLLGAGFRVYLGSDHGHVEARGVGAPSEGVVVETRGRRARTYREAAFAEQLRERLPGVELDVWGQDGLLPDGLWAVMPRGREAFAPRGETTVTHGGVTVDEVVVPFVTISAG